MIDPTSAGLGPTAPDPSPARRGYLPGPATLTLAALAVGMGGVWMWAWPRPKPRDHWPEVARARALLDHGRPDLALRVVSGIRDDAPGAGEAMTIAGRALLSFDEIRSARLALERALRLQPDQTDAIKHLAAIYLASGDGQRGAALLHQAAALDPDDPRPWLALGKVYHDMGDNNEAASAYAEALRRSPDDPDARRGRIAELLEVHRADEATPLLDDALRASPEDAPLLGLAARHAQDRGRASEALALADRALGRDPDNLDALLVRARHRHVAGQPELALPDLERAVGINPNEPESLQLLALVEARLGLNDRAAATRKRFQASRERAMLMDRLTREISQRPLDPEPRWRLGQVAVEGGLPVLAYQCFQAALDLDPDYRPAREALQTLQGVPTEVLRRSPPATDDPDDRR